jgi:drug/metabolite transporter (DMT)-like permease
MLYLTLCIISSTSIMIVFKLLNRLNVSSINAIVINYFTASLLGFIAAGGSGGNPLESGWFPVSLIMGFVFVFMFNLIGYSTRIAGLTVTSLTTKLSVVIPVIFSIVVFNEELTIYKLAGMVLALSAIVMIVYKPFEVSGSKIESKEIILVPVVLFFGAGAIDSFIKYSQEVYVPDDETLAFSATTFLVAAFTSVGFRLAGRFEKRENKWYRLIPAGIALGVVNFGSLFFLVMALGSNSISSSVVFGINNIGIVLLSVIVGMVIFGEKLSLLNKAGIFIAILSILILYYG